MELIDVAIVVILIAIIGTAAWYIYKSKKSGKKCIGCPEGGTCSGNGCAGCSCGCYSEN